MKKEKTTYKSFDAAAYLDNQTVIAEYLSAAAEDPNPDVFVAALGDVAKARGMAQIAKDAGLGRESLYKTLSAGAHPRFETINSILHALGVTLAAARKGATQMATFWVFPATAESIRACADHFGSVSRAIQVAVEILYERAERGELFEDEDDGVIGDLCALGRSANSREGRDRLRVPLAFSIPSRTDRLIERLAGQKYYATRNSVIMFCGTLLPQLYSDFVSSVLTPTERRRRWRELNAKLDARAAYILGDERK